MGIALRAEGVLVQAQALSKTYSSGARSVTAVADLDLQVASGEFMAICGHSGSGKSTLLAMLGGLSRPTAGQVQFNGADIWALSNNRRAALRSRQIGFVFQFASLLPTLRAIDNVALPALIADVGSIDQAYARAEELLQQVGLGDRLEAYPGELSGGQQRRVALARALINEPALLLADEPTGDLDEQGEVEIFQLLLELHRARSMTLLVVTHSLALARHADRVIHLREGRITVQEELRIAREIAATSPSTLPGSLIRNPQSASRNSSRGLGAELIHSLAGFASWVALVVVLFFLLNQGVAWWQRSAIQEKRSAQLALQNTALHLLRADVDNLTYRPDGSYLLTLYAQNLDPEEELHVLTPVVRAFVQIGKEWRELPLGTSAEGKVSSVSGKERFEYTFQADVPNFEELIPGYMHVRFRSTMLVGKSNQAADGLYERNDDFYVYLKPQHADDDAILKRTRYPGKPPVWIPMPAH